MGSADIIQFIVIVVSAVGGAYITVRVSIAELKKDISHLKEKLDAEISQKNKMEDNHNATINEVRDDVKTIFRTLTKKQVDQAKAQGQETVLKGIKDAVENLNK